MSTTDTDLLILVAVLLPPQALNVLGHFVDEKTVQTPYGNVGPVAKRQTDSGQLLWVQPYMGLSTRTDPRATIYAARELGVRWILNWDMAVAVNSILRPGETLIINDYIDWTRHETDSFAGRHGTQPLLVTPQFCPRMNHGLQHLLPMITQGTYLGFAGPRRETPAEARMFRTWGVDVLGQNLVPEVSLANECAISYGGLVTVNHYSTDQTTNMPREEIVRGLESTVDALPQFIEYLSKLPEN